MKIGNIYVIKEKKGMIAKYLGRVDKVYDKPKITPNLRVFEILDYWDYPQGAYENNRVEIFDSILLDESPFEDVTMANMNFIGKTKNEIENHLIELCDNLEINQLNKKYGDEAYPRTTLKEFIDYGKDFDYDHNYYLINKYLKLKEVKG